MLWRCAAAKLVLPSAGRHAMRRRRHRARILITSRFAMAAASPGRLFRDNNIKTPTTPHTPLTRQPSPKGIIVVIITTAATSKIITIIQREKSEKKTIARRRRRVVIVRIRLSLSLFPEHKKSISAIFVVAYIISTIGIYIYYYFFTYLYTYL